MQPHLNKEEEEEEEEETLGSLMILRDLEKGIDLSFSDVLTFAFDKTSNYLVISVAGPEGKDNGLYFFQLKEKDLSKEAIKQKEKGLYTNLYWTEEGSRLAFLEGKDEKDLKGLAYSLWIWDGESYRPSLCQGGCKSGCR